MTDEETVTIPKSEYLSLKQDSLGWSHLGNLIDNWDDAAMEQLYRKQQKND